MNQTNLRRAFMAPAVTAVLATGALVFAIVIFPDRANVAIRAYLVLLGLLSLWGCSNAITRTYPRTGRLAIEAALRTRPPPEEPLPELRNIAHRVSFARFSAFDYHHRLRPLLRDLAAQRLAWRSNVDLDADPESARRLLGDRLWEALQDRGRPDRDAPGMATSELRSLVDSLESL